MSIKGQGHSLTLVKGHSDFKVKCLTFGLYTQVSDSGPLGPLVWFYFSLLRLILCAGTGAYAFLLHIFVGIYNLQDDNHTTRSKVGWRLVASIFCGDVLIPVSLHCVLFVWLRTAK